MTAYGTWRRWRLPELISPFGPRWAETANLMPKSLEAQLKCLLDKRSARLITDVDVCIGTNVRPERCCVRPEHCSYASLLRYGVLMLRSFVTDLTPPVILRPAQKLWRQARGLGAHTFEGSYHTLRDVPCGEGRYDDDALAEGIANSLEQLRTPDPHPTFDGEGRSILPVIVGQLRRPAITVLDFGGGACTGLRLIADHVPALDPSHFSYILVETSALCRAIKRRIDPILMERFKTRSFVEISDVIPSVGEGSVIVNASSVIQYITNWRSTVTNLAALSPDYFIVGLTPFTDAPTYARQQLNIPHRRVASWVFNRDEFLSAMGNLGYRPIFEADHDVPVTCARAPAKSVFSTIVFQR